MLKSCRLQLLLAAIGLMALLAAGCENVPSHAPYPAIQTGFCEPVDELEDNCVQPLDMTVEVHE